jgi:tetratricopeptide (TPR) repeat protein
VKRRRGNWDETIAILDGLRRLMPEDPRTLTELATSYLLTKQNRRADRLFNQATLVRPDSWALYSLRAYNYLAWGQPMSRLRADLQIAEENGGAGSCSVALAWILAAAAEEDYEDLLERRRAAPDCNSQIIGLMRYSFDLYAALAYRELDREQEAEAALDAAGKHLEDILDRNQANLGAHAALGVVHALAGRREQAILHAQTAMKLRPISEDLFQGAEAVQLYVRTLAQLGEPDDLDEALRQLDVLLSMDASITIPYVLSDPFMAPIVGHPRFRELVDRYPANQPAGEDR